MNQGTREIDFLNYYEKEVGYREAYLYIVSMVENLP